MCQSGPPNTSGEILGGPGMWRTLGDYQSFVTKLKIDVIAKFLPVDSDRKTGGDQLYLPGWNQFPTDRAD